MRGVLVGGGGRRCYPLLLDSLTYISITKRHPCNAIYCSNSLISVSKHNDGICGKSGGACAYRGRGSVFVGYLVDPLLSVLVPSAWASWIY